MEKNTELNEAREYRAVIGDIVSFKCIINENYEERVTGCIYDNQKNGFRIVLISQEYIKNKNVIEITDKDLSLGNINCAYYLDTNQIYFGTHNSVVEVIGRVNRRIIDEMLRKIAKSIGRKHFNAIHSLKNSFVPGETYVRIGGRVYDSNEIENLIDSSMDFWLTTGRYAKEFQNKFTRFLGSKYCILTNSGSSANLLAISALTSPKLGNKKLLPNDEVITTACAFPTTINPIIQNNLKPVFLDITLGNYNVDIEQLKNAISSKTKCIFLDHKLGNPFDLKPILDLCEDNNIWLIEDACDALGSKYMDKYAGTIGHIGTYSFYPAHHMTMGEGGALVTNDILLKRIITSFRDWGRDCWCETGHDDTCKKRFDWKMGDLPLGYDHKYIYTHIGYNLKITDMQASIGVAQLNKLQEFTLKRKRNWKYLYEGLKKLEEYFVLPRKTDNSDPSWFGFALTVKTNKLFTRSDILLKLEKSMIATRMMFTGNILLHPAYKNIDHITPFELKNTQTVLNNSFWIGVYPELGEEHLNYVIETISSFINEKTALE
jgi:CDP-4-dehydro-6-deoxyglucose reductase, E1